MKRILTTQNDKNFDEKLKVLKNIAKLLNKHHIVWSLGASMMLKLRGVDVSVDDIDIIVKTDCIDDLDMLIKPYNPKKDKDSSTYPTAYFYELSINDVDVDIMIGFKVNTKEGVYSFDDDCQVDVVDIDGTTIYLSSLEEWLKAYTAMNRPNKIKAIQNHLIKISDQ